MASHVRTVVLLALLASSVPCAAQSLRLDPQTAEQRGELRQNRSFAVPSHGWSPERRSAPKGMILSLEARPGARFGVGMFGLRSRDTDPFSAAPQGSRARKSRRLGLGLSLQF